MSSSSKMEAEKTFDPTRMDEDSSGLDSHWSDKFHDEVATRTPELEPIRTRSTTATGPPLESSNSNFLFNSRDIINRTLRHIYPKESAAKVNVPVFPKTTTKTTGTEVDHFFEIQHIIVVFLAWMDDNRVTDLNLPFGAYVAVSAWANSFENLFVLPGEQNQAKKSIAMKDYRTDDFIAKYLTAPLSGTEKINVATQISRLLSKADTWEPTWRGLIKYIARGLEQFLPVGWRKFVVDDTGTGIRSSSSTSSSSSTMKETLLSTDREMMPLPPSSFTTTASPASTTTPMSGIKPTIASAPTTKPTTTLTPGQKTVQPSSTNLK